jgi:hypothetical protein
LQLCNLLHDASSPNQASSQSWQKAEENKAITFMRTIHTLGMAADDSLEQAVPLHHREEDWEPLISDASPPRCDRAFPERTRTMALIMVVTCFLFMDQNLLAPHLTDVAREFNFTDTQRDTKLGGELSLSLFLVGGPAALFVGYWADRVNRRNLYTLVVLLGEAGCFLVLFVQSYWQLFVLRALTGIALGGAVPLVFSMIADMYSAEERPPIAALVSVGSGVGAGIGQFVSAALGDAYGWRVPFAVVAVPSCLTALAFLVFASEPERGAQERNSSTAMQGVSQERQPLAGTTQSSAPPQGLQVQAQDVPVLLHHACHVAERSRDQSHQDQEEEEEEEDEEGQQQHSHRHHRCHRSQGLLRVLSRRSNLIIFMQGIPGCVPVSP